MQKQIKRKSILVVGCGGLGAPVAEALASEATLLLADGDVVDRSNLPRQWAYQDEDVGARKAEVLATRLGAKARGAVRADEALDYDLILECSDNTALKFALGDAARKAKVPFVVGGVAELRGFALSVLPGHGPCLRCVFESPSAAMQRTCRDAGVLSPLPALVAAVMVDYAQKALGGQASKLWSYDFAAGRARSIDWPANPRCPVCA